MAETTVPEDSAFRIELPSFEGPLDLLLHLIKKHELSILDLPIAFVTERYLHYLEVMRELDLDVAAEYLLMAATLAHIKSKSLLPSTPGQEEEESEEAYMADPRAELIHRLLEYQKYKQAAEALGSRSIPGRDVFLRGSAAPEAQGQADLAPVPLFSLLDALESIMKRVGKNVVLEVNSERISIQERITQIADLLRVRRTCTFIELFEGDRTRYEVVVTFLAMLEMTKLHMTRIYQADKDSPIHVQYALLDADAPSMAPPDFSQLTSDIREVEVAAPPITRHDFDDDFDLDVEDDPRGRSPLDFSDDSDETLDDDEIAALAQEELELAASEQAAAVESAAESARETPPSRAISIPPPPTLTATLTARLVKHMKTSISTTTMKPKPLIKRLKLSLRSEP